MPRGLTCYQCGREGRVTGAVGVGRAGEPACRRHVQRRQATSSRAVALRRVAASDRRSRASHLRFLGDLRAALRRPDVSLNDVAEAIGVTTKSAVLKMRDTAERDGAVS